MGTEITTLASEEFHFRHKQIKEKLTAIDLPEGSGTNTCWAVAGSLGVTGQTVKNYLEGNIKDGFLAEAIYKEFKRLKIAK